MVVVVRKTVGDVWFDQVDPFADGAAAASNASTAAVQEEPIDSDPEASGESDEEYAAAPADFAEDIYEACEEERNVPLLEDQPENGEGVEAAVEELSASTSAAALVAAVADEQRDQAEHQVVAEQADQQAALQVARDEAIRTCTRIKDGTYIITDVAPWSEMAQVGRITVTPKGAIPEKLSVACKCYMHPTCSLMKKRLAVTDATLIRWLFAEAPMPYTASAEDRRKAAAAHKLKFWRIIAEQSPASGASSSGAQGSTVNPSAERSAAER